MTEQLDIDFNPRKHARRRDPQTSLAAAESMVTCASAIQIRVLDSLLKAGPGTQSELAERLGMTGYQIGKRTADLKNAGLIEPSGETRPGPSGRAQTIWLAK